MAHLLSIDYAEGMLREESSSSRGSFLWAAWQPCRSCHLLNDPCPGGVSACSISIIIAVAIMLAAGLQEGARELMQIQADTLCIQSLHQDKPAS